MALTSVTINQQLSANLTAEGIRRQTPLGGTNVVTDAADIGFEVFIKSGDSDNDVTIQWKNDVSGFSNKPSIFAADSTGGMLTNQAVGSGNTNKNTAAIMQDPVLTDVPSIAKIIAVYYESPSTNTGTVNIASSDNALGDISLKNTGASALLIPRLATTTTLTTNFTFTASSDVVKIIVLANST
jgi:hypothetical protein